MILEIIIWGINLTILYFFIREYKKHYSDSPIINTFYPALIIKLSGGIVLGLIYKYYYHRGDTFHVYEAASILTNIFHVDYLEYLRAIFLNSISPLYYDTIESAEDPRFFFFVRLVSPLFVLANNNYWIVSLYLSFIGFIGMWSISNVFIKIFKASHYAVLISFLFLPSLVFWGSGVLKESVMMGVMGYIISVVLKITYKEKKITIANVGGILLASIVLVKLKYYYAAILLPVLFSYAITVFLAEKNEFIRKKNIYKVPMQIILLVVFFIVATNIHHNLSLSKFSSSIVVNHYKTLELSNGNNVYYLENLEPTYKSILYHLPNAEIKGIFGPFLWDCTKPISFLQGIESTLILLLFISIIIYVALGRMKIEFNIEVFSIVVYVFILAAMMAIASPNWGSLVRYKIGYIPFFIFLLLNKNPLVFYLESKLKFFK